MGVNHSPKGLQFSRRFTKQGTDVFDQFEYDYRTSVIRNPSGEVVFEMTNVEVPKQWSQIATDILAQKYFRKAGVPQEADVHYVSSFISSSRASSQPTATPISIPMRVSSASNVRMATMRSCSSGLVAAWRTSDSWALSK